MLTDYLKDFHIIKANQQSLTCMHNNSSQPLKLLYREMPRLTLEKTCKIETLSQIFHPNLLQIYKTEKRKENQSQNNSPPLFVMGLQTEFITGSLQDYIGERNCKFEEEEVLNTFRPVEEALQFLFSKGWQFTGLGLQNIGVTESQNIKYIDKCITKESQSDNLSEQQIYEQLCEIIYPLLVPQKTKSKSWKARLKVLKGKRSKQAYDFFTNLCHKFGLKLETKTKKISKTMDKSKKEGGSKCKKYDDGCNILIEGKQNKIVLRN